ncbi:hypothetical protein BDR05DRAFT_991392 [Suillus weaverae]|nr:hypothetical protein BDR05DRAFT_991392 [Suillus weaverae]
MAPNHPDDVRSAEKSIPEYLLDDLPSESPGKMRLRIWIIDHKNSDGLMFPLIKDRPTKFKGDLTELGSEATMLGRSAGGLALRCASATFDSDVIGSSLLDRDTVTQPLQLESSPYYAPEHRNNYHTIRLKSPFELQFQRIATGKPVYWLFGVEQDITY